MYLPFLYWIWVGTLLRSTNPTIQGVKKIQSASGLLHIQGSSIKEVSDYNNSYSTHTADGHTKKREKLLVLRYAVLEKNQEFGLQAYVSLTRTNVALSIAGRTRTWTQKFSVLVNSMQVLHARKVKGGFCTMAKRRIITVGIPRTYLGMNYLCHEAKVVVLWQSHVWRFNPLKWGISMNSSAQLGYSRLQL